jgi:hypothetical protein
MRGSPAFKKRKVLGGALLLCLGIEDDDGAMID